jgi:hypothetical protein
MCETCTQKAENMARLARFFRDAAAETRQDHYRTLMSKTAIDLDGLQQRYLAACQCGLIGLETAVRRFAVETTPEPVSVNAVPCRWASTKSAAGQMGCRMAA